MAKNNFLTRARKQQAQALFNEQRWEEAKTLYQQVCRKDPHDGEAWTMLGVVMGRTGRMDEAAACFRKAVSILPDFADAHYNLGKACKVLGLYDEAVSAYESAVRLRQNWAEAWINLGHVYSYQGRMFDAIESYRRALTLNPDLAAAYKSLSGLLIALGRLDEAAVCMRKLAQLIPGSLDATLGEIKILQRRGDTDQAYAMARDLFETHHGILEVDFLYATLCGQTGRQVEAIDLLERRLATGDRALDHQQLSMIHYHLGDQYDAIRDYHRAFEHYKSANQIKSHRFDMQSFKRYVDCLIEHFNPDFMRTATKAPLLSDRPLFIVGMMRSGTTLVEQILASHPDVCGAGELHDINTIVLEILDTKEDGQFSADSVINLCQDRCNALSKRYLDRLTQISPDARYVTDKMPQNFLHLGIIAFLFPRARIIHCIREPLDTCVSCYFQNFGTAHPYTHSLEQLGQYYREYHRLMHHWQKVIDIPILDIGYEELVSDQEGITRKLLEFCDLEWNDQCLRFYENKRAVATLSHEQVRKPVYAHSIGRWKHYDAFITPLIDVLGIQ